MFILLTLVLCMICIGLYGSSIWYTTQNDNDYSNNLGGSFSRNGSISPSETNGSVSTSEANGSSSPSKVNGSSPDVKGNDPYGVYMTTYDDTYDFIDSVNAASRVNQDYGPPTEQSIGEYGYDYGPGTNDDFPKRLSFKYIINDYDYIGENNGTVRIDNNTDDPRKFYIFEEESASHSDTSVTGFNKYKICTNSSGNNCLREFGDTVENKTLTGDAGNWRFVKVNSKDQYVILSNSNKYICIDESNPYANLKLCRLDQYDNSAVKVTLVTHPEKPRRDTQTVVEVVTSEVFQPTAEYGMDYYEAFREAAEAAEATQSGLEYACNLGAGLIGQRC